jgi:hypothetical protein
MIHYSTSISIYRIPMFRIPERRTYKVSSGLIGLATYRKAPDPFYAWFSNLNLAIRDFGTRP